MAQDLYVGMDIGSSSHEAYLVTKEKTVRLQRTVKQSIREIGNFIKYLEKLQEREGYREVIIGMEGSNGYGAPMDRMLIHAGFRVVSINSIAMDKYRLLVGQPRKDDPYDAKLVAHYLIELCSANDLGRSVQEIKNPSESSMGNLRILTRELRTTKRDLTRVVNRLTKHVLGYFPDFIAEFVTLQTKTARTLLKHYPSVSKVKKARASTIAKLQISPQRRVGPKAAAKLKSVVEGLEYLDPLEDEMAEVTEEIINHMNFLIRQVEQLEEKIEEMVSNNGSVKAIVARLSGAGLINTSELLAEIGDISRFATRDKLSIYCGIGCLNHSSGKSISARKPTQMNHRAKGVLCMMANVARLYDPRAKAYYEKKRKEGKGHWHATKCLAKYLLRKIYSILQEQAAKEQELPIAA